MEFLDYLFDFVLMHSTGSIVASHADSITLGYQLHITA